MVCTCPDGYVSDDNGSCKTLTPNLAGCTTDDECGNMDSCNNQLCKDPCACREHAFFRVVEHKPVQPRRGLPLERVQGGRRLFGHARLSQQEVPAPVRAGQPAVRRRSHLAGHQIRGRVLVRPRPGGRSLRDLLRGGLPLRPGLSWGQGLLQQPLYRPLLHLQHVRPAGRVHGGGLRGQL